MKSRDIVAGWPRGHSFTRLMGADCEEQFASLRFRVGLGMLDAATGAQLLQDLTADQMYHDGQQRMMQEWLYSGGRNEVLLRAADKAMAKLARIRADAWALSVEGTPYGVIEPVRRLEGK